MTQDIRSAGHNVEEATFLRPGIPQRHKKKCPHLLKSPSCDPVVVPMYVSCLAHHLPILHFPLEQQGGKQLLPGAPMASHPLPAKILYTIPTDVAQKGTLVNLLCSDSSLWVETGKRRAHEPSRGLVSEVTGIQGFDQKFAGKVRLDRAGSRLGSRWIFS